MSRSLKSFARAELDKLQVRFPYLDPEALGDPQQTNGIFNRNEWTADGPATDLAKRRDWQHLWGVDCTTGNSLEVFFERVPGGLAVAWARLSLDSRTLVLAEACYKDHSDAASNTYCAGGIRLECTGPLRYWRLSINALFRVSTEANDEKTPPGSREVHVKVGCRISMLSHTFELPKHCSSSLLAKRYEKVHGNDVAKARESITACCTESQAFVQGVAFYMEITVDGERREVLMHGRRLKNLGRSDLLQGINHLTGYAENGTVFHLLDTGSEKLHGFCFHPSFFDKAIKKGRIERGTSADKKKSTLTLRFTTATNSASFPHSISLQLGDSIEISELNAASEDAWVSHQMEGFLKRGKAEDEFKVYSVQFKLPGNYRLPPAKLCRFSLLEPKPETKLEARVVATSEDACKASQFTGGKGSSLATLHSIAEHLTLNGGALPAFTVPPAIVLTVEAYKTFANLPQVQEAIQQLLEASKSIQPSVENELSSLKAASERCVVALRQVALPSTLESQLTAKLGEVFGSEWETRRFAVRSSAVGEDSEEMSAAGQMTTYLGVEGRQEILDAIVKCWASQFSLTALNYKRQYGQAVAGPMAVVVQEMAQADCAGVMFTCDPVTSRPGRIVLTANFGLGESVVSASVDTDSYTLAHSPGVGSNSTKVTLLNKTCGAKDRMIVQSQFGGGTEEQIVAMDEAHKFCLSDDQAIQIAEIGLKVSEFYDSPRDIEWAMVDGKVVLLQCRPVTSIFHESDFEIVNDLNTGMYTHREVLSRANLDEVMPGALSVLSISLIQHILFDHFSKRFMDKIFPNQLDKSQFTYTHAFSIGKRLFMNFSSNAFGKEKFIKNLETTMFGSDVGDHEAIKNGIYHDKCLSKREILQMSRIILQMVRAPKTMVDDARKAADQVHFEFDPEEDSLSMLMSLLRQMYQMQDSLKPLLYATFPSSMFHVFTLNILKKSQGEKMTNPETMVMLSKLLRSDYEVETATIPEALTNLATSIRNDPKGKEFAEMSVEAAVEWLQNDQGEAAKQFRAFRKKHAHRCYKEFDIFSKTWDMDPMQLVTTLRASVLAGEVKKKEEERMTISDLEKQPSFMQKKLLNYMIPKTQYFVYAREATKSTLIKTIHQVRLAARKLAEKLHAEGRVPDADLAFFLTTDEIYRLITTRNPALLPRAIRRCRMHARLNQQRFPMLLYGWPRPIKEENVSIPEGARSLSGTPVSEGIVTGKARVVHDFSSEAHLIRKGEILITRATDTGWTPYFPLLEGVVTEIGGLLSHGAVVAREYGLPAVVGVLGCTEFFKSGEIITLDGNNGIVAKQADDPVSNGVTSE